MTDVPSSASSPAAGPAEALLEFIDAAPSPYHAVAEAARRLRAAGFVELDPTTSWPAGGECYVISGGAIVAWSAPPGRAELPFRMIAAHTDSPNLRLKPRPDRSAAGFRQLAIEPYGGLLLNSWLDRDLGLSGRVVIRSGDGSRVVLVRDDRPLLRIPQLAIHLDRGVNESGLVLDPSRHLSPVWGTGHSEEGDFARWLAALASRTVDDEVTPADLLAWDLMLHDVTPASFLGRDEELVSAARLDNLCSCHGAITALIASVEANADASSVSVAALFDHEEVGSESATGASGTLLAHTLERMVAARGGGRDEWLRALAESRVLSADMAHGTHPNYAERHDPEHRVVVGGGPVIKVNVNQRYASDAPGAAEFRLACEAAGVPVQVYAHRNDLPCGSTIGPITAAGLGVGVVDVGMAQLAMHSARELMGRGDVAAMVAAFGSWLALSPDATAPD